MHVSLVVFANPRELRMILLPRWSTIESDRKDNKCSCCRVTEKQLGCGSTEGFCRKSWSQWLGKDRDLEMTGKTSIPGNSGVQFAYKCGIINKKELMLNKALAIGAYVWQYYLKTMVFVKRFRLRNRFVVVTILSVIKICEERFCCLGWLVSCPSLRKRGAG